MEYMFDEDSKFYKDLKAYAIGARDMMRFMHDYYEGKEPVYPSEMEDIYIKFLEQYFVVKDIDQNAV